MSDKFLDHLMRLKHTKRKFGEGELLFERGDPVASYYVVDSGRVHLMRRQEDGAEVILQRATSGAVLAEASLDSDYYHCSAVAVEPTTLVIFSRASVQGLLANDPSATNAYYKHLAGEVQSARRLAEILSLRRVADRLDAWMIWNDDVLPPKGQWHQIAEEISVSYEALYRELARRR